MVEEGIQKDRDWVIVGETVRGATHIRNGAPNQDAIGWLPDTQVGKAVVAAVSDGHGSPKCCRSDRGADFAIAAAKDVLARLTSSSVEEDVPPSAAKGLIEEQLPRELAATWLQLVASDLDANPLHALELSSIEARAGENARQTVEAEPAIAYGTTLLAVGVTGRYALYLQVGDGDVLTVYQDGSVSFPVPTDERVFGDETTSLSAKDAWKDFRVRFESFETNPPVLIVLSTDGYSKSFSTRDGYERVGPDMLSLLRGGGIDVLRKNLKGWLEEVTSLGSGDDISVVCLCRTDTFSATRAGHSVVAPNANELTVERSLEEKAAVATPNAKLPALGTRGDEQGEQEDLTDRTSPGTKVNEGPPR